MRRMTLPLSAVVVLATSAVVVAGAMCIPLSARADAPSVSFGNFSDPSVSMPYGITPGPDGALWFTNNRDRMSVGRITTSGAISSYTDASVNRPLGIAVGPDGALWFANFGNSTIGRITTSGAISSYADASINRPFGTTAGPDNAVWFTNPYGNSIGRIGSDGKISNYTDSTVTLPYAITVGPDGALWFATWANKIGRITTGGAITTYTDASISGSDGITTGPDGALWFTNHDNNSISRITTAGAVTTYTHPSINHPTGITLGPDQALRVAKVTESADLTARRAKGEKCPRPLSARTINTTIAAGPGYGRRYRTRVGDDGQPCAREAEKVEGGEAAPYLARTLRVAGFARRSRAAPRSLGGDGAWWPPCR